MAKTRRIIRKLDPPRAGSFEDQLWAVYVALILLGGFLIGAVLVHFRFDDPRPYANAIFYLILIPMLIAAAMLGAGYLGDRLVRRSMQLAFIVSVLLHVAFLIIALNVMIFSRLFPDEQQVAQLIRPQPDVVIPDYHPAQLDRQQPRQDFERPVETPVPELTVDPIERQILERPQPPVPQPQPVEDPEETVHPHAVPRAVPSETVPRHSEHASQLSRQSRPMQPQSSAAADLPQQTPPASTESLTARESSLPRRSEERAVTPTPAELEPETPQPSEPAQISRATSREAPTVDSTAAPTARDAPPTPRDVPRTPVQLAEAPATTEQTEPEAPRPASTAAQRRETTAPEVEPSPIEPTPVTPQETASTARRSELPTESRPTTAEAPDSIANQRTRLTDRPEVSRQAETLDRPESSDAAPEVQPRATQIVRQAASDASATSEPPVAESPSAPPTDATLSRQTERAEPDTAAIATAPPDRRAPASRALLETQAERPQPDAVADAAGEPSVEAADVSVARRAIEQAAVEAAEVADVSPDIARADVPQPSSPTRDPVAPAPEPRTSDASPLPRTAATASPTAVVAAETEAQETAASQVAQAPQPQAASSQLERRQTAAANATMSGTVADPEAASPSAQLARTTRARSVEAEQPAVTQQAPTMPAARATRSADVAASPVAQEAPAVAESQAPESLTPQPAATAVARGQTGSAGVGQSPNLDRTPPAEESPSQVASASARRERATQQSDAGPALTPSHVAEVRRARADAQRPQTTQQAQEVEIAAEAGTRQPEELTASSSAAVTEALANVERDPITAATGQTDVDFGPTRVVTENRTGRASGGGQPEPSTASQIARSDARHSMPPTLMTDAEAPTVEAPDAAGGGQVQVASLEPSATSTVRSAPDGQQPVSAAADPTAPEDMPAETSTADVLARTQLERASGEEGGAVPSVDPEEDEDELERRRRAARLARSGTRGSAEPALQGPAVEVASSAPLAPGEDRGDASPAVVARAVPASRQPPHVSGESGPSSPADSPATGPATESAAPADQAAGQVASVAMRRAEAAEAASGPPAPGGGSDSPERASRGPQFAANPQADRVSIAGLPQSAGAPSGTPLEAQGIEAQRQPSGLTAAALDSPIGALAGEVEIAGERSRPGEVVGRRQQAPVDEDGPSLGDGPLVAFQAERGSAHRVPPTATEAAMIESQTGDRESAQPDVAQLAGSPDVGPMSRRSGGGLAVELAAVDGPGGLGAQPSVDTGIDSRRASSESDQIQLRTARFIRRQDGGPVDVNTAAVVATEPFRQRMRRDGASPEGGRGSPGPETEEAIERGLAFLARYQSPDGSWTLQRFDESVALASDTAATGLALLAFQGAGYTHLEFKYADTVRRGLEYLLTHQQENGDLFLPLDDHSNRSVWLYSHAIAAIALCEAYGMTQDPDLRDPAQRALDFIVESQHPSRGGWRYSPQFGSDTSVTGWMMMALKSGELANLEVSEQTYEGIDQWLESAQASPDQPHLYRYNPHAPDTPTQGHGRRPSVTMTSVGLLMRLYAGWDRDHEGMQQGAEYLLENLPAIGTPRAPQRDTYYWYYATQVMFYMGGEYWERWNRSLRPLLVDHQIQDGPLAGSWDPRSTVPDRWAPHAGRLYVTTMNLLSLEVYYRHLPLYEAPLE